MASTFYLIVFIASLVMTMRFTLRNKKANSVFIVFAMLVVLNNLGRYLISVAGTTEMAIWANKLMYVGGCFVPMLLLFTLADLCKIKISGLLKFFMLLFPAVVMAFVLTIGYSDIYYREVELVIAEGGNYLKKTYGPAHSLYPVMMLVSASALLFFIIYAIRHRKSTSFKNIIWISVLGGGTILTYIFERLVDTKVDLLSVCYLISVTMATSFFERINMFDMSVNISNAVERMREYGYVTFDLKKHFMNANALAYELFPEVKQWNVEADFPVPDPQSFGNTAMELLDWAERGEKEKRTIETDGRYLELSIRDIIYNKRKVGYLLEIIDRTKEKRYTAAIEHYNEDLKREVSEKTADIMYIKDMMVLGMASMVESRDNSTGGHVKRTSKVVEVFAKQLMQHGDELGISERLLQQVVKAAPMHDLGKITVSDSILKKQGKYTEEEYSEMKKHAAEGGRIVDSILSGVEEEDFVEIAKNVAYYHHEKWDGKGYPNGLAGQEIPLEARIMALADVFDALVSKRCYKEAFSFEKAFSIIEESLGSHFDPELGRIFIECRPELEAMYSYS